MKRLFFFSVPLLFALFFSCTKEMNTVINDSINTKSSLEEFSILLSKAIYAEPELRTFMIFYRTLMIRLLKSKLYML